MPGRSAPLDLLPLLARSDHSVDRDAAQSGKPRPLWPVERQSILIVAPIETGDHTRRVSPSSEENRVQYPYQLQVRKSASIGRSVRRSVRQAALSLASVVA